ncbi:hypothetical protein A2T55_01950 [Brevibacterium linens]|uniref:DUF1156 domain-containing protein n=1 Tax=Brevibacterium linens TaxID=1703 RepID=A0A144M641_BRELN|nr:DUF1156 domain-containing protein [Brevibacterium linens]AMT92711.1 hypothetical protein A2T55_01950 [Brevibacterium linens]
MSTGVEKRKLIEVSIPLEAINEQAAREKSIRHGHPSTLHLWWARRPLAAARCVLFAQLVDDPSSNVDQYRAEAAQHAIDDVEVDAWVESRVESERERLHKILTELADWDNLNDEVLWGAARKEILKSTGGNPPPIVDPFAGGGAIPLEAQRLGLEAHASDLNPVAVLINRAMIEIPPKFAGLSPVHPNAEANTLGWSGAQGLAEDVRRYGEWMRDEAEKRIGGLYPKATLEDGAEAPVIAWIWARTVTCPNPACGIEMPLVRSWWLGKKKGKEAYVVPEVVKGKVEFSIGHEPAQAPTKDSDGTMSRGNGTCLSCQTAVPNSHIREQATSLGLGKRLMATVASGKRARVYLRPSANMESVALSVARPRNVPSQVVTTPNHDVDRLPMYGMPTWSDAFTNRQLKALTTFSDLVGEARGKVLEDVTDRRDAETYADAVATYLALVVSRLSDYQSTITTWASNPQMEILRNVFARQAIPMAWDFAEGNPFASSSGSLVKMMKSVTDAIERLPATSPASATQEDAADKEYKSAVISTDPPYYDNIGYSDLSDFFYVWLRRSLRRIHPDLFGSMLVPKDEELVANPYRHDGRKGAQEFFEHGFRDVFAHARETTLDEFPITVYYAFKQTDTNETGTASTGWETLLEGMVRNRWQVTSTWPMRSERTGRMIAVGTNALASSIVLSLRPRKDNAGVIDKRQFRDELLGELPDKLREMQQGTIAPVDLAQAAIGPGMAVYSKYDRVLEADGSSVTVRQALQLINTVIDEVLDEQESDFDSYTRWCVKWFAQFGFDTAAYGTAETLASATNTSLRGLVRTGAVESTGGKVRLLGPDDFEDGYRPEKDNVVMLWEIAIRTATALDRNGVVDAGRILSGAADRIDVGAVKELAFLGFKLAEKRKDSATARLFNALATSWPEVTAAMESAEKSGSSGTQGTLDLEGDLD